jgi:putative transposase
MKEMYQAAGISKQALWKHRRREGQVASETGEVVRIMKGIRERHKRMGCRHMYYIGKSVSPVGRDIFERIGLSNGFRVKRIRSVVKTTWAQKVEYYPNLIEGKVLSGINQVWQSDIFYIMSGGGHFYGVTILDIYSRKLLALCISRSLAAKQLVLAMKKALKARAAGSITGCIFHSDRGSQYISKSHKLVLGINEMLTSMCLLPQENAYVERVQGTLKHDYIEVEGLRENNMAYIASKTMRLYNDERPHTSLNGMTPTGFEKHVGTLPIEDRPQMPVYKWDHEMLTKNYVINKKKKELKKKKSTSLTLTLE